MLTADRFAREWPTLFPRPDPATNCNHASMIKGFGSHFAGKRLDEIDRLEALVWARENPNGVRYARTLYHDAIDAGLLDCANPFSNLRLRAPGSPAVEIPTEGELKALIEAADPELAEMIGFAAYTGLRLGELLALEADKIHGDRVRVDWQIHRGERKPPKGGRTRRVLVPPQAPQITRGAPGERLWPMSASAHHKRWKAARDAVGVAYRFHALRHYCATWWLDRGASPLDVSLQLGHRDGGDLVRRRYGHPDPELAFDRLAALA